MNGAELLVETLAAAGVTKIFALSGNQIMPIFDACIDADIEITHVRHEAATVYMAEAYAQVSGKTGVALVTAGAGIANALGPMFTTSHSETPVIVLSGDSPLSQDGQGAFQEMDQVSMTASLTKLSVRPKSIAELKSCTDQALAISGCGKQGPVHLVLADDLLRTKADEVNIEPSSPANQKQDDICASQVEEIGKLIADANHPLVIFGPALNETRAPGLAAQMEDKLQVPVVSMESPRGFNDPSLGDLKTVFTDTDLFVVLGKPVDFTLGFGRSDCCDPNANWVIANGSPAELERAQLNLGERAVMTLETDPEELAGRLVVALEDNVTHEPERQQWLDDVKANTKKRSYELDHETASGPVDSKLLCAAVQRQVEKRENCITICDGGEFGQWAQAATHAKRRVINGVSGAIGGGICYAIGAKSADPDATVLSLMGDGTAGFHFMEFETAVREDIRFVAVIGNDLRWNAEHQIQLRDYGEERLSNCQLSSARYDQTAVALGGHGEYVTDLKDLDAALDRAIASGKPACVNVIIDGLPAPSGPSH